MKNLGTALQNSELSEALRDIYQRTGNEAPELPPGACEACWEIHECFTCHDGGRVRVKRPLNHPDFGKSELCPDCQGYVDGVERPSLEEEAHKLRIPQLFATADLGYLSKAQADAIADIVYDKPEKPMLTLAGNVGAGKTYAAVVALKESLRITGKYGRFWPTIDLLERFKASYDEDRAVETTAAIEAEMRRIHLLVLDDIGKHKSTQWAEEKLFKIVDERYRERRPLIITTNVTRDQFESALASRLFGGHAEVIEFAGADRRMAS